MSLSERQERPQRTSPRDEAYVRPGTIIVTLVLMGITALFAGACAAYLYFVFTADTQIPAPPLVFLINIPVLLLATYYLQRARHLFPDDGFHRPLLYCALLSVGFALLQLSGWLQFFSQVSLQSAQIATFLFILSALHLLHVLAGLPFLFWFMFNTRNARNIARKEDTWWLDYQRGLVRYWRFLDILWVILVVILWAGYGIASFQG